MIRESAADVHEARRMRSDSTIVSYVDEAGQPVRIVAPPRFNDAYVRTREAHVEDWVALLVANHLFAGADAYVAANLWDVQGAPRDSRRAAWRRSSARRSHGERRRSAAPIGVFDSGIGGLTVAQGSDSPAAARERHLLRRHGARARTVRRVPTPFDATAARSPDFCAMRE